jgi:acetoacetate decarboxylase
MRGRTLALWFKLVDPDEARRHVPGSLEMEEDPVVRARFWDMEHDALTGPSGSARPWQPFREAVVAFPVRHRNVSGDYPTYMYADDFTYMAFGREVMGWPVRDGHIEIDPEPPGGPASGLRLSGSLRRDERTIMTASIELTGAEVAVDNSVPPKWLATKVITGVAGPRAQVGQLVATGPERIHSRRVWQALGSLAFGEGILDELDGLAPREVVDAQYWTDVGLTVGWGEVLEEVGENVWTHG